ncbi:MAG: DMT family transporter, partial [Sneathiella sp.]|nr:DMT family transporter [Sneathiella sp.]
SFVAPFNWTTPDLFGWGMLALIGLIGGVSHFIIILAFSYTTASNAAPFAYTQLIWATLFGFIFFGKFPDNFTIIGAVIIVCSGLYILYRERVRAEQK